MAVGDSLHPSQGGDATLHRVGLDVLHVAAAVPEPYAFLLSRHHLEPVADAPGDDQMEAVGAQIECSERLIGNRLGHLRAHRWSLTGSCGSSTGDPLLAFIE